MDQVIAARAQMGTSLAFHIVFAALGVGLPLLVVGAHAIFLRARDPAYDALARTWAKGMAILFAVGAVSGTILSFELGLLWPTFMRYAGGVIGLPFSLEGFAFFIEAIFIGLYLYGRGRLSPRAHLLTGIPVVVSGPLSAVFVTAANAWMNTPAGFRFANGVVSDVDPLAAMFNPSFAVEAIHTTLAAYVLTGFGAAGVCAVALLRGPSAARRPQIVAGLRVAMLVGAVAIPLQAVMGDVMARFDAEHEPAKFAAMETLERTQRGAPVTIGGIPSADGGVRYGIEIPYALSLLASFDPNAEVTGLDRIAPADRPPVAATHLAFDAMVGSATLLVFIALAWAFTTLRRREPPRALLAAIALGAPLSLLALEAGWCTTEFGRQPWIVHGVLRTDAAATTAPGIALAFYVFSAIYVLLAVTCWWLLRRVGGAPHHGVRVERLHDGREPAAT